MDTVELGLQRGIVAAALLLTLMDKIMSGSRNTGYVRDRSTILRGSVFCRLFLGHSSGLMASLAYSLGLGLMVEMRMLQALIPA